MDSVGEVVSVRVGVGLRVGDWRMVDVGVALAEREGLWDTVWEALRTSEREAVAGVGLF